MKYIATFILLLSSIPGLACECAEIKNLAEAQKKEFERSEMVFIGQVVSSDYNKGVYQIKIIEQFKGKSKPKTITGKPHGYCSLFPSKEDDLWLIYAEVSSDGSIYIPDCGLSRSFRSPYGFSDEIRIPPPSPPLPLKDAVMDELDWEVTVANYRRKALLVLKKEIEQLRKWE